MLFDDGDDSVKVTLEIKRYGPGSLSIGRLGWWIRDVAFGAVDGCGLLIDGWMYSWTCYGCL